MLNSVDQQTIRCPLINAEALNEPIYRRRAALTTAGGPIEHLQLKAQQAVIRFYTLTGSSAALSYALGISGYFQPSTAIAAGLFGIVYSFYDLQRVWSKAVRRFWQNYTRVQEGLQFDVQASSPVALIHLC